jgi:site-specific DNA-methyltransferase (adenine-specific)
MKKSDNSIVFICADSAVYIPSNIQDNSVQMIYLDPPFFKQTELKSYRSTDQTVYSFSDKWNSLDEYLDFIKDIIEKCKKKLTASGLLFLHCDTSASHYLRVLLDRIFGRNNFVNEIIWSYKRWSNSASRLLEAHQNIYIYANTNRYKFKRIMLDYSPTTNIDQILQMRERNAHGVVKYKKDSNNNTLAADGKQGVPLRDIWEIPFLNPKAKERVGYPTQKPIELMNRIIKISCDDHDLILDPFCGSGTMGISAHINNCHYIGIDISKDAIKICKERKNDYFISESSVLDGNYNNFNNLEHEIRVFINAIGAIPVERNKGLDGIYSSQDGMIGIRFQRKNETIGETIALLNKAVRNKPIVKKIIIKNSDADFFEEIPYDVIIVESLLYKFDKIIKTDLQQTTLQKIM